MSGNIKPSLICRIFLLWIFGVQVCVAQQNIYNYLHFTTQDGLPSNIIRDIKQDQQGFLWLTTKQGLAYFDGTHFFPVNFNTEENVFSTDLGQLGLSDDGLKMWITTYNQGLLCYDRTKPLEQAVTAYGIRGAHGQTDLEKQELYAVCVASSGLVYFGGQETDLQVLDPRDDQIRLVKLGKETAHQTIYCIREDAQGILWIGTRYGGIFSYDPATRKTIAYDLQNSGENGGCASCFVDDEIYASYYDYDMVKIHRSQQSIAEKTLLRVGANQAYYDNHIHDIIHLPEQQMLLAAHRLKGIYTYHLPSKDVELISWEDIQPKNPVPTQINTIYPVAGGYFLCTGNGLFYYGDQFNRFHEYIPDHREPIQQLFRVGNAVWYLSSTSMGQLSADYRRRLSEIDIQDLPVSQINVVETTVYLSTYDRGVYVCDTDRGKIMPLEIDGDTFGFEKADCNTVLADTSGGEPILWIGSWNSGLYRYHMRTKEIKLFHRQHGLPDHKVIGLGKDQSGEIWVGMDGFGAIRIINKVAGTFSHFQYGHSSSDLASNTVFAFLLDSKDKFWYSSARNGIGQITSQADRVSFEQIQDNHTFPWTYAHLLKEDQKNRIWMKTSDGVMIFDPESLTFHQLLAGDGIFPPDRFKVSHFYFDNSDLLWMTDQGLVKGKMDDVYCTDMTQLSPLISAFKVANQDHTYRLLHHALRLNTHETSFSFTFSTPGLIRNERVRYAYRLEGIDDDWVLADAHQQAVYSNVSGGRYTFSVKVGDLDGNWSENILSIPVYVKTKWYQTWGFKVLVVGLVFLMIFLFQTYRINQQKRINQLQHAFTLTLQDELEANEKKMTEQAEILEREKQERLEFEFKQQLYESELKAIRSQMNPHFIFNILNSIEAYVVENDADSASNMVRKFAALSRIVLENSQFAMVSIASELHLVELYLQLEQERFDYKFHYEIEVDPQLDKMHRKIPSMLIQPIVENAVHHGIRHLEGVGKIKIRIVEQDGSVLIDILDNGVGFTSAVAENQMSFKNSSFGLKGVENRLKMLNNKSFSKKTCFIVDPQTSEEGYTVKVSMLVPVAT